MFCPPTGTPEFFFNSPSRCFYCRRQKRMRTRTAPKVPSPLLRHPSCLTSSPPHFYPLPLCPLEMTEPDVIISVEYDDCGDLCFEFLESGWHSVADHNELLGKHDYIIEALLDGLFSGDLPPPSVRKIFWAVPVPVAKNSN